MRNGISVNCEVGVNMIQALKTNCMAIRHKRDSVRGPHPIGIAFAFSLMLLNVLAANAATSPPLVLERTMVIPDVPVGPYIDSVEIDVKGNRLFATPQAAHTIVVFDLTDGRILKTISGIGRLHSVYYSPTLKRLFVPDAESGDMKVFDGVNYSLIKTFPLSVGADSMAYDETSHLLYVASGYLNKSELAKRKVAVISVVDPVRMEKVTDIPIPSNYLESIEEDQRAQLLYVAMVKESAIAVVDLRRRKVVRVWKLPAGRHNPFGLLLNASGDRLYVSCRDDAYGFGIRGTLFALDTKDGRAVATRSIGGWADDLALDEKRHRIYVSTGVGRVETYVIESKDILRRLPDVETPLVAKDIEYSSELDRLYVDAPRLGLNQAQVLVFRPIP